MQNQSLGVRLVCAALMLTLVGICCIPVFAATDEPGYVRTVFNQTNGLPTDEANTVLQTADGYLWIGSNGGLLRYNGTNFRNFSAEGAIPTPSIRTLFEDSTGRLWIGSSDAGVFVYQNGVFTAVPCADPYGFLSIRDFIEDQNGKIYVASSSGVCEITDGSMVPLSDAKVSGETIYSLGIDPYNRLWCAMNAEKCAILQDGQCVKVLYGRAFFDGSQRITCLTSDRTHHLYLGTNDTTLAKISFTGTALDGSDFSVQTFDTYDAAFHNRIYVTQDEDIFISGEQGFAYLRADGTPVDPHTPYRTNAANWATMDYEGNVWLATSNEGLVRYTPGYFSTPNSEAGLSGKDINSITEAGGLYYVATDLGLLAFDSDWHPIQNAVTRTLENTHIKHLLTDRDGRLWCATYSDFGLVRYDPANGELRLFNEKNGMKSPRIRLSYEMADGTIAVGTQDGLALIRNDQISAFYDKDNGMETQSILCIAQASNGALLAGSAGSGLYAIASDGTLTTYSYEQGLLDGVVLRVVPSESGDSYFICAGSHLYQWRNGSFIRFDNLQIGQGSIFDLFERSGTLWLMQDSGLYAVNTEKLLTGEQVRAVKYGVVDGLTGSLSVNTWCYHAPDGRLYLSTRNGISIFDFRELDHRIPALVIDSIQVDDTLYECPQSLTLDKNSNRVTIRFSALTFSGTSDLCIGYELVGFSKKELLLYSNSGSVSYTNLRGGTYTLRLRVFDPENPEIQKTTEITLIKEKKLTEQPLIWIAGILLFGLLIFYISHRAIHTKMNRLRKQKKIYRSIVEQALQTFANTIDAKDPYTKGHSVRVAIYAQEITKRLGYSENDQETVYYIALLHDIGKIAIPDSILNKEGALTPEERAVIQTHPIKGAEILRDFNALKSITDGALYHHERYDGKGYCAGLAGENIPLVARIICVADCYDAMSSDRCYRKALTPEQILAELREGSGTKYDPKIAAIMEDMIREGVVPSTET